jgi:hypothetical protein
MAAPPRKRRLSGNARRALEMLAADQRGITEALMLARGFTQQMLTGLIRNGLAMRYRMPLRAGARTIEVTYMMITAAGRRALED